MVVFQDFALHWKNHSDLYFKHKQTTEMFIHSEMLLRVRKELGIDPNSLKG